MIYQWKDGSRHKVSAQIAGEVCSNLDSKGALTAKNLVEVSRPQDAPLHTEFEWNNEEAAERWREYQARTIIRSITVVPTDSTANEPVRAFVNISYSDPEYESIEAVVCHEDKYSALLNRARQELLAFKRKYRILSELAPVFSAIDALDNSERKESA